MDGMSMPAWLWGVVAVLAALFLVLFCLGAYLLIVEVRLAARLYRRARYDYRAARGTQHLAQLQTAFPALRQARSARQSGVDYLARRLAGLQKQRDAELVRTLSRQILEMRLTEVPGIGPKLSRRILHECFRDSLRDLDVAYRVYGIGPTLQYAISSWVQQRQAEMPGLLAGDFAGKREIVAGYVGQERVLEDELAPQRRALDVENQLYDRAQVAISRLQTVKWTHFWRAARGARGKGSVPPWYFEGIYPPWEPMPKWFETMIKYAG